MLLGSMDNAPPSKEGGKVAVVVVGQVAHFNLTPEAYFCRGIHWLQFALSGSTEEPDLHNLFAPFALHPPPPGFTVRLTQKGQSLFKLRGV